MKQQLFMVLSFVVISWLFCSVVVEFVCDCLVMMAESSFETYIPGNNTEVSSQPHPITTTTCIHMGVTRDTYMYM